MSVKILYISNDVAEIIRELKKFHKSTKDKRLVHKINALFYISCSCHAAATETMEIPGVTIFVLVAHAASRQPKR
jgi:hypothetical protein